MSVHSATHGSPVLLSVTEPTHNEFRSPILLNKQQRCHEYLLFWVSGTQGSDLPGPGGSKEPHVDTLAASARIDWDTGVRRTDHNGPEEGPRINRDADDRCWER